MALARSHMGKISMANLTQARTRLRTREQRGVLNKSTTVTRVISKPWWGFRSNQCCVGSTMEGLEGGSQKSLSACYIHRTQYISDVKEEWSKSYMSQRKHISASVTSPTVRHRQGDQGWNACKYMNAAYYDSFRDCIGLRPYLIVFFSSAFSVYGWNLRVTPHECKQTNALSFNIFTQTVTRCIIPLSLIVVQILKGCYSFLKSQLPVY